MARPIVLPIPASLQRKANAVIKRRPDLQSEWLKVMDGSLPFSNETAHASAYLEAMDADKKAKLEGEWE